MFDDDQERAQAVAVPLFYGLVEAVVIGIYCVWAWKVGWTKAPADENICTVVTKSYEINHDENAGQTHDHASDGNDEDDHENAMTNSIPSSPESHFENEAIIVDAMEARTKQERAMGGRGFWVQMRRLFKDNDDTSHGTRQAERPVELKIDPTSGDVDAQFTTPPPKDKNNRRRMTSDYTVDTAGSMTPSPQVSTERQFLYSERTSL